MSQAVIMAGGQGERFWPMTHAKFPKYRIRFDGRTSLLGGTYARLAKVFRSADIHVVTTRDHVPFVREELPRLRPANIHVEPFRNNTAAAIYLSTALLAARRGPEETVSFFPADHLIADTRLFERAVRASIALAKVRPTLVTIGIRPAFPATGYGYIECGRALAQTPGAHAVRRFVEKPGRAKAASYLRSGRFLWNAGIFTWRAGVFLEAMGRFAPEFRRRFDLKRLAASYKRLPSLSIDYALLEKADNIAVVKSRMDWCDMGNWDMLFERSAKGPGGVSTEGPACIGECRDSLFVNRTGRPFVALGVKDLVIVQTERGTLVAPRGRAEEAARFFQKNRKP